jgi:antitoxin component YwqK of YwqJK toxin-antitoxin module/peroxiredoxin
MSATVPVARACRSALLVAALCSSGCQLTENLAVNLVEKFFRSPERSGRLVGGKQEGEWVFRYDNGATKAKGKYLDDKQIGHWTYWHDNGNVEWEGEFDDARLSGPSFFGYSSGQRRAVGLFADGLEEDLWTFWNSDGTPQCEGDFVRGRPALRWTYFHPDGSPMAEGYRLDGERIGPWQFYRPGGEVAERRFPVPEGIELVHETWNDATPRKEGFLIHGVPQGRWVTWHPNGRRRLTLDLEAGLPQGFLAAWAPSGEPLARGRMERGRPVGNWLLWRDGQRDRASGADLRLQTTFSGEWSEADSVGVESLELALGAWIGEAAAPAEGILDLTPDPNVPAPSPQEVARTDSIPTVPLRPQPWTLRETDALDYLVARYSNGASDIPVSRSGGYGRRRDRAGRDPDKGDPLLSPRFLGTELAWTRFYRGEGEVVDLDDFRGKKKVVLTVLRGFAREVCVYCVTQTEALCDNVNAFKGEGCEVFVVYPGERNRLDAFMESFKKVSKHMGEPPIGVLYDRNMELVTRMGLASELAIPSTFVLDEQGVVRYSYVGSEIDDRPPAEDVLAAIRKFSRP